MLKNMRMPLYPWFTELSVKFHEKILSMQNIISDTFFIFYFEHF